MPDPTSRDQLRLVIEARLRSVFGDPLPANVLADVATAVTEEHLRLEPERTRIIDRPVPFTGDKGIYPIHNSDLKLVDESAALAVAIGAVTGSGWLGVLAKLVPFLYRIRRKRGRLEGEHALALLALKDAAELGWRVGQVRDHLKAHYSLDRGEDQVRALLEGLQDVRLADGSRTKFADEQQGMWFVVDV